MFDCNIGRDLKVRFKSCAGGLALLTRRAWTGVMEKTDKETGTAKRISRRRREEQQEVVDASNLQFVHTAHHWCVYFYFPRNKKLPIAYDLLPLTKASDRKIQNQRIRSWATASRAEQLLRSTSEAVGSVAELGSGAKTARL